jgi:hypothetical protein
MDEREVPSACPNCRKPMWREGRRIAFHVRIEEGEGTWAVCRHCSGIFRLSERRRELAWREPSPKELAVVFPQLAPMAFKFAAIRQLEAMSPGWLDRAEASEAPRDKRRDN